MNLARCRFRDTNEGIMILTRRWDDAGIAGFLLAKCAATRSRRKPKDWYDIAYVLLHNDIGGPAAATEAVLDKFEQDLRAVMTARIPKQAAGLRRRSAGR